MFKCCYYCSVLHFRFAFKNKIVYNFPNPQHIVGQPEGKVMFNLLESLEDLVDQLGRGKMSEEDVLETLNNIVNYEEDKS